MHLIAKSNIIRNFLNEQDDGSAVKLIEHAKAHELNDSEIIELAQGLANSGESMTNDDDSIYCDIPSTGGPSSLSTLICPLFLKIMGGKVIKLGVPGRPAGGIDVLAQIMGYKTNPSKLEIKEWLSQSHYVHFLADQTFVPLDAKLFDQRKRNGALNIPGFVIASLLSKKIAVGLKKIGLDIRISSFGNFGRTTTEARANADRFNKIAATLGITCKSFITNGETPQQPYIGRGESILALNQIFKGKADDYLKHHLGVCQGMACSLFENETQEIPISFLKEAFYQNISIQGGDLKHFDKLSGEIEINNKYTIKSIKSGILSANLLKIREAITIIQHRVSDVQFPDPCGLIIKAMPGQYIEKGSLICSFRCINEYKRDFELMLTEAFCISNTSNEFEIIA